MYIVIDSLAQRGKDTWRMSYHPVFEDGSCGERDWYTIKGAKNKREAKKRANERRRELEELIADKPARALCGKTLLEWEIERVAKLVDVGSIQPSTAKGYVREIRMCKLLANADLAEIDEELALREIKRMRDADYKQNTITKRLRHIRQSLDKAVEAELINKNPVHKVKLPKMLPTRASALTVEERDRMLGLVRDMEGALPLAITFGLGLGVRGEEVCGFKWSDCKILQGKPYITVNRAVVRDGGKVVVKDPKTVASHRDIPMAPFIVRSLDKRREWFEKRCHKYHIRFSEKFYILGDIDGEPLNPDSMRRMFKSFCVNFDFDCTYHELRHTYATTMIASGLDVRSTTYLLGHSDPGFTLRVYCDADKSAVLRSVDVVNDMFAAADRSVI